MQSNRKAEEDNQQQRRGYKYGEKSFELHSFIVFNRRELPTTDTLEKAIAEPANTGESSTPKNGYSTPAAMGMPTML